MVEDNLSPEERAVLCSRLVLLAPPCEFNEVLEDVRCIAGEDVHVHKKLAASIAQYNKDQMIPVKLPNATHPTLLTSYGDLGNGYFLCPRSHSSFHYDHLKQIVSNVKSVNLENLETVDSTMEVWRHALEEAATAYIMEHFPNGAFSVYAPVLNGEEHCVVLCIQSNYSKHQSTGRWRSEWTMKINGHPPSGEFLVHGIIKVQTHLYEEGNVQLISSKEIDFSVPSSRPTEFAKECMVKIKDADCTYQHGVGENFKSMSDKTFKALRRQLPVTRSKIDWNKIITYQVGNELTRASP